jgi:hypothetical protein
MGIRCQQLFQLNLDSLVNQVVGSRSQHLCQCVCNRVSIFEFKNIMLTHEWRIPRLIKMFSSTSNQPDTPLFFNR